MNVSGGLIFLDLVFPLRLCSVPRALGPVGGRAVGLKEPKLGSEKRPLGDLPLVSAVRGFVIFGEC